MIYLKNEKIDFVIAWVDGSDPKWQKEKNNYSIKKSDDVIRFRDWDNLKYWFRAVEKYTPWVNNIYFITWGHIPKWLNTEHPKLKIINHEDYIPKKYLPTFSSHVIELNLHRIKELSENFVYFNDDMFITDYCSEDYFFHNGLPRDVAAINATVPEYNDEFYHILNNNCEIINHYFNKKEVIKKNPLKWIRLQYGTNLLGTLLLQPWHNFIGFKISHMPTSLKKSTMVKLWELEEEKLTQTCMNKFRTKTDVNQYVFEYWQVASGKFYPRKKKSFKYFDAANLPENFLKIMKNRKYKMVCINDSSSNVDFELCKKTINDGFFQNLSEKSLFEMGVSDK